MMSVPDAARELRVSPSRIYRAIANGIYIQRDTAGRYILGNQDLDALRSYFDSQAAQRGKSQIKCVF